jgi:site-specific DNA-methyltransferase (adenine-specific)
MEQATTSGVQIIEGDCVSKMNALLNPSSIDCILADPPYEIGFAGKGWDNTGVAYNPRTWRACHRVLKDEGYLLVFAATRTQHRIAHAIQRAGFEVVNIIAWCYGTGFPKSVNVGKAMKKKTGEENGSWNGWGTSLKPAYEPIIVARKMGSNVDKSYHHFHYISKPNKKEKNAGLENTIAKPVAWSNQAKAELKRNNLTFQHENDGTKHNKVEMRKNFHPTVKPVALMKALIEDFTDEQSLILDPFLGSGTTGIASVLTDRDFVGIELTPDYIPLAESRIEYAKNNKEFFL